MRERPILFSSPMVRTILAGQKTQTRRVVRKQFSRDAEPAEVPATSPAGWQISGHSGLWWDDAGACFDDAIRCPYGQTGDRLWVREAWRVCGGREYEYMQDQTQVMYRATHQEDGFPLGWESYKWRPSIHMPRWASRISLEITGVRVERLNDISELDAKAEGCSVPLIIYPDEPREQYSHAHAYRHLWESINGKGSWAANPWVWAIEFKRVTA